MWHIPPLENLWCYHFHVGYYKFTTVTQVLTRTDQKSLGELTISFYYKICCPSTPPPFPSSKSRHIFIKAYYTNQMYNMLYFSMSRNSHHWAFDIFLHLGQLKIMNTRNPDKCTFKIFNI